jgi:predicted aminopeptidase
MPRPDTAILDRFFRLWVPLLLLGALSGCTSLDYYTQLAQGQAALLRQRQPVARLLADPAQPPQLRQRLSLAQQARGFASQQLRLPDNRSYRSYAELGRPYVLWNVFATPAFSLAPQQQCFPIAGCVAYRGYYQPGRARGAAALLEQQGLDVWIGGVEAYSTLGWFDDPLLSSMLRWDDQRLVGLIFHELAHQQLYVPGDTAFNESFATFVEREGLRQWQRHQGGPAPDEAAQQRYQQFVQLVLASRERLQQLYASELPRQQMAQRKAAEFERLRQDYRQLRDRQWKGRGDYDAWINGPLNNAKLLPFGLYDQWVPAFARLFEEVGGDWPQFYRQAQALGALPAAQRMARLQQPSAVHAAVAPPIR